MFNSVKLYLYGAITLIIGIFAFIFRLRGDKIERLKKDVHNAKVNGKIKEFEAENRAKAEGVKDDKITITDGNYSI